MSSTEGVCAPSPRLPAKDAEFDRAGVEEMSRKKSSLRLPVVTRQREVQKEIDGFLRALNSYPDRVAQEPFLSFEEHLLRIVSAKHGAAEEARRREH